VTFAIAWATPQLGLLAADTLWRRVERDGLEWIDVDTQEGPKFGPVPGGWLFVGPLARLGGVVATVFEPANIAATRAAVRAASRAYVDQWQAEAPGSPLLQRLDADQQTFAVFAHGGRVASVYWDWQARDLYGATTDVVASGPKEVSVDRLSERLAAYQTARDAAADDLFAILRATGDLFARVAELSAATSRPTVGPMLDVGLVVPSGERILLSLQPAAQVRAASDDALIAMSRRWPAGAA